MNHDKIKNLLKSVTIFKELNNEEIEHIVDIAQPRTFARQSHVFMQGDELDRVFFIYKGKVKIYKTDIQGKEQIVSILKDGDMFPHVGFFRKGGYPAHAEIIDEATIIVIPIEKFEQTLLKYPELSIKLFRVLGEKIIDLQNRLEEQILHNSYHQIVRLLLRLTKTYSKVHTESDNHFVLTTQFTNRELANMIGSSRETVSRTLTKLKKKKLVHINPDGFFIINKELLEDELL